MKRIAIVLGLVVVGGALAPVVDATLGTPWVGLGWRKPVADWLVSKGVSTTVAAYWGLVWILLPTWAAALAAGAVIGRVARSGRWLQPALAVGAGYVAYSIIYAIPFCLRLAEFSGSLAMRTFGRTVVVNLISLVLLLLAAWLFRRRQAKPVAEASPSPAAEGGPSSAGAR